MSFFQNLRPVKTTFLMPMLLAIFACLVRPPSATLANGPLPFFENFNNFTGAGFDPNPASGQLDSNVWIITGLSDGSLIFGDSQTSGDFARGPSSGGETTGGIYAFDVNGSGNTILGVQPTASDFAPGEIILRLQNTTGATITELDINYDIWHLNNADRANSLDFSYSPNDSNYTTVPSLDFVTPQAADGLGWQSTSRSTILTGLTIVDGDLFYLKWTGDDVGGSGSRDEYGLDEVQIAVPTGDTLPAVVSTTPVDGAANIAIDANIELGFNEAITVAGDWFQIDCGSSGLRSVVDTVVIGGPTTWVIDPNSSFANGETCTVTVFAAQVTDQDGAPDMMTGDYTFSFTIAAAVGGWVINEIHADPDATLGDANNDGDVNTTQDEFIEIVNNTGNAVNISGWTLADGIGIRHTFSAGTTVPDQCGVLVFGGGTPTGIFGGVVVQVAGALGLNNGGDTVTLNDGAVDQATYTYGSEGGDNQSLTRDPDITGAEPLVRHSTATGAGGALFSPGTRIDGSPFSGCSVLDTPPFVAATNPVSNAVEVAIDANLELTFSEAITAAGDWFRIDCGSSGTRLGADTAISGGPATWIIDPNIDFASDEMCTVTVFAAQVTDQDGAPDTMTGDYVFSFTTVAPQAPPARILISEFLYDGLTPSTEGDEFIELCNPNPAVVDLTDYKVGDEESSGSGESMYYLPAVFLDAGACLVIAKDTAQFEARFGAAPDFEVSDLTKHTAWGSGGWSLANSGDELLVLGPGDEILDSVAYRNGDYAALGLEPAASAPAPYSLQRVWPTDTDSMPHDFVRADPNPGVSTEPPPLPATPPPPATLPGGMKVYWGSLHAHSSYSDGAGPPFYAFAVARAAGLHFYGLTDHGWWLTQARWDRTATQAISATAPGQFVALRGVEWTPESGGHLNIFNSNTLLQKTDPQFDTLPELYAWLTANPAVIAQFNHPDPGYGGTFDDFAYNVAAAPRLFLQEIGNHAQGYRTYEASFVQSNAVGWRVSPTNNGDAHSANWGADTIGRTGIVAPALTEADLLAAMRARRVFSTEDGNLALALRSNGMWMGSVLTTTGSMPLIVDVVDPDPEPFILYLYDGNLLLATESFSASTAQWTTTVEAQPGHFYWVKVVQADGHLAYSAPLWLEGQLEVEPLVINEILPAPHDRDWDGDGTADQTDEWLELYNPLDRPVGLGGWRLADSSGATYDLPLGAAIPAKGYATFYYTQTGIALNNGGDSLTLTHPNGTLVDSVAYDHSPGYDEGWCRLPDGGRDWSDDCEPSPNAANWEKVPAGPLTVSIYDAKRLTRNAWVRVRGRVTAPPGLLGSRTMYIQDETAGIMIYLPKDHGLRFELGEKVELTGDLRTYHEEFEIVVDESSDVKSRGPGAPVHPLPIVTTSLLEPYEGLLVQLHGRAVRFKGGSTFWLDDGTDPARVYLKRSTGIRKPFIEPGTEMTVVGIVSHYADKDNPSRADYRLLPRYQTDLQFTAIPAAPAGWPVRLPDTGH